jgi:hypothetical protein
MSDKESPKVTISKGERGKHVASLFKAGGGLAFKDSFKLDSATSRKRVGVRCMEALERELRRKLEAPQRNQFIQRFEEKCLAESSRTPAASKPTAGTTDERPSVKLLESVSLAEVHCALQDIISSPYCADVMEIAIATAINSARTGDGLVGSRYR